VQATRLGMMSHTVCVLTVAFFLFLDPPARTVWPRESVRLKGKCQLAELAELLQLMMP
jgi:hypothetical protein